MADNISVLDALGASKTLAADDIGGGILVQRIKREVGVDGSAVDFLDKASRSDTFTAPANGTAVDVSAQAMKSFGLQVKKTGTVSAWNVVLEVSLDGTNYATVLTHTEADGDGAIVFTGASFYPALHFRARCVSIALSGGTNVIATIVGLP